MLKGTTYFGPAILLATYYPYQVGTNPSSTYVFLPGVIAGFKYGSDLWNNFYFRTSYYHSTLDNSLFIYDLSSQLHIGFLNSFWVWGLKMRTSTDPVLPEDRYPLSGSDNSDLYTGLSKIFGVAGATKHQVSVVVGKQTLSY